MNICVVGTGYVGLVTAACLAHLGHRVVGVDSEPLKVEMLCRGEPTIYEPGLTPLLQDGLRSGRLSFGQDLAAAMAEADVIFLCVGTPPRHDGSTDLSQMEEAARQIGERLRRYKVVVEKSTVPVYTADRMKRTLAMYSGGAVDFDIASNPEFLREGAAVDDFLNPDRIVVGVETTRARDLLLQIYEPFRCPLLVTDVKTAELVKHASNAFLAMKISFINMIADLCEATGTDVQQVADGMGYDRRIGRAFLNAGVGYGGSCFPKDLSAFIHIAEEHGADFSLLREVRRINETRVDRLVRKLHQALWVLKGKRLGVLGLSFKPNTDDIREAPSLTVIPRLRQEGAVVRLYDPHAAVQMASVIPPEPGKVEYARSPYEAAEDAHALVILTEWEEFRALDLEKVRGLLQTPIIVDGRNLFDPAAMAEAGFEYFSIGRPDALRPRQPQAARPRGAP
ncbi:MAG: UDP-glucose/GDP-mannose dehydrogenase family protein [Armatimonadetes bacterium]|nr:UDP-glucose/GDP-mannose dehydrogenase family protein [Armatimonadota bacterium]